MILDIFYFKMPFCYW